MDEAKDIIDIVEGIVPNVEAALSGIVEKQAYIDEFIVPGPTLYLYLEVLDGSTTALANSIIELIPVCILSIANYVLETDLYPVV